MTDVVPPSRYSNGRKKRASRAVDRLNEANAAYIARTMSTALSGPHRRGNSDPLCECPIGRFVLRFSLASELAEAAFLYANIRGKWLAAICAPAPDRIGGSGADPEEELIRKWDESLSEWRRVLLDAAGRRGRDQINMMVFDLIDFGAGWDFQACSAGLTALAKSMKKI
jgi:hypothetical protein